MNQEQLAVLGFNNNITENCKSYLYVAFIGIINIFTHPIVYFSSLKLIFKYFTINLMKNRITATKRDRSEVI